MRTKIVMTSIAVAASLPALAFACFGNDYDGSRGYGMMGWGDGMGGVGIFAVSTWIVWTVVGVLAGIWLWKQINKNGGGHNK